MGHARLKGLILGCECVKSLLVSSLNRLHLITQCLHCLMQIFNDLSELAVLL